jgi:hypothetical protein
MNLFLLAASLVVVAAAVPGAPSITARRLDQMAERLKLAHIGAPRLAIYDVAWPADRTEYEGLGRSGVLQVTVVAADHGELPVRRVYVRDETGEHELQRIGARTFDVPAEASVHAVGAFREDSYYLLPEGLADHAGLVLIDLASHRKEFDLAPLPLDPPTFSSSEGTPRVDGAILAAFVKREFKEAPAVAP